jgi:hypothetical protein
MFADIICTARAVTLKRDTQPLLIPSAAPSTPICGVVDNGVGYIDTSRVEPSEVDSALETVRDQPCLV